jgi:phenylalanyl-tRNA synthetase beta chain
VAEAPYDTHDLRGVLDEFFERFGVRGWNAARCVENSELFLESAQVRLGRQDLGRFGQLNPRVARQYDLRAPVFLAELNLDLILARRNPGRSFKALPVYPAIQRDVAMFVPESVSHEAVLGSIQKARSPHLNQVALFDVFRGHPVPENHKSMAYSFVYRSPDRTLTDAEVNAAHDPVVAGLKADLSAIIREAGDPPAGTTPIQD